MKHGVLLLISCIYLSNFKSNGECLTSNTLGTIRQDVIIETENFDLQTMMSSILDLVLATKMGGFELVRGNFIKTPPGNNLCALASEGVRLQRLGIFNRTYGTPIMTSSRIVNNKVLLDGLERSALVDIEFLSTLLSAIGIENHVQLTGRPIFGLRGIIYSL